MEGEGPSAEFLGRHNDALLCRDRNNKARSAPDARDIFVVRQTKQHPLWVSWSDPDFGRRCHGRQLGRDGTFAKPHAISVVN
jgi:hypothetical protein